MATDSCEDGCRYATPKPSAGFPLQMLTNRLLRDAEPIDTLVVLNNKDEDPRELELLLTKYRRTNLDTFMSLNSPFP